MARHLRVLAAVAPRGRARPRGPGAARGARRARAHPDPDVPRLPARAAARGIFWGFVLLTIGTANAVTGGHHPDDRRDPVRRAAVGARQRACRTWSRSGSCWRRVCALAAARHEARAPHLQPRRAGHPRDDRGARVADLLGKVFEAAPTARSPARSSRTPSPAAARRSRPQALEVGFAICSGSTWRRSRRSCSTCPAASTSTSSRRVQHVPAQARPARRAAEARHRGRERDVRPADAPGPRLEGPPRRVHVHRVRPLPGRVPGLGHRQAPQPPVVHHGHPGHERRGRARRST